MRIIIAGSRGLSGVGLVAQAVAASGWSPSMVISGGARGVDLAAEQWARAQGIPSQVVYADWDTFGRGAGCRRNIVMASMASALIAIWDGVSPGTAHMVQVARQRGLQVFIFRPGPLPQAIQQSLFMFGF
ncbi:MAG TPA: SLOG family protein [Methylomirabilota bacterium]|nr:SLOG family protein [Methylomirabilota bacterium]